MALENLKRLLKENIPDYLYHYTDRDAFKGIITNKEMWATHIRFLNDFIEQNLALDLLLERLPFILNSNIDIDTLKEYIKSTIRIETLKKDVYIISFSEKSDDLGQWRGYGNKIPSYCIELSTKEFINHFVSVPEKSKIVKNPKMFKISDILNEEDQIARDIFDFGKCEDKKQRLAFVRCIYEKNEQIKFIDELISDSLEYINNIGHITKIEKPLSEEIAKRFVFYSSFIKDSHFKDEAEWRIVIIYEKAFDVSEDKMKSIKECLEKETDCSNKEVLEYCLEQLQDEEGRKKFDSKLLKIREGIYCDKPYYKFSFPIECFSKFIIGSCPDKNTVGDWTLKFLFDNGFSIDSKKELVVHTEIPYRNWNF